MTHKPAVELATDEDMAEVLALLQKSFASVQRSSTVERGAGFWHWKYRSSPFGQASIQVMRIDGRIAATGCLWPMTLFWKDQKIRALQPCDTAVHPDFRRQGLFGQLNNARKALAAETNVDLIFNFPNANSLPGYIKSGWQHLGRVPWLVRVIKPAAVLRDRFHPGQSSALDIPADYRLTEPVASEIVPQAPDASDRVALERPEDYWKWRFCEHPNRQYGFVRSGSEAGDLAVFTLSRKASGLVEMVVVDLVCRPQSLTKLLKAITQCARRLGAGFIALMKPQGLPAGPFHRRGFVPVREKNLAILPVSPSLPGAMADIECWDFRAALHDSI